MQPDTGPERISIEEVDSIARLPAPEWDRLADNSPHMLHGWLLALEESRRTPSARRYWVTRDRAGLLAALPIWVESSRAAMTLDDTLFGRMARLTRWLPVGMFPALTCGTETGISDPVLVRPGVPADVRRRLLAAFLDHAERAAREGRRSLCFRGLPGEGSELAPLLAERGFLRAPDVPTAFLPLPYASFAEYRKSFKQDHPRMFKNLGLERNHGKRLGLVIEPVEDPRPERHALHRLLDEHFMRLNRRPFTCGPDFLERLKSHAGDRATISVARLGGRPVGVAVILRAGDTIALPMVGMDEPAGKPASAYFNLAYNRPIEDGIAAGCRGISYGKMMYRMKRRRGCQVLPVDMYLRGRNRLQHLALAQLLPIRARKIERVIAAEGGG